jgi:hypothetical protein
MPLSEDLVHANWLEFRQGHHQRIFSQESIASAMEREAANEHLILANGIKLDPDGYLTKESLKIASQVTIPHEAINIIEAKKETCERLQASNAMFFYAELMAWNCNRCQRIWTETAKEDHDIDLATTRPRPS